MKPGWQLLVALSSLAYPLLWYWGRDHGLLAPLAAGMALLWGIRSLLQTERWQRLVSALLMLFFVLVLLLRHPGAMYWYPVLVNLLMLLLFASSLLGGQSLVERLARIRHPDLPAAGVRYTRRVTQIWCIFFVLNGGVAAGLVLAQAWRAWALYTGVIAYVLMGALFLGEWCWRRRLPGLN